VTAGNSVCANLLSTRQIYRSGKTCATAQRATARVSPRDFAPPELAPSSCYFARALSFAVVDSPPVAAGDFCGGVAASIALAGGCSSALCAFGARSVGVARSIAAVGGCFFVPVRESAGLFPARSSVAFDGLPCASAALDAPAGVIVVFSAAEAVTATPSAIADASTEYRNVFMSTSSGKFIDVFA